jgi:hypothetical protein
MITDSQVIESYQRLKNLKLVGKEVGMPWQTVYVRLTKNNVPITGDKLMYGSETDKFAAQTENEFQALVPDAINNNEIKFQSKTDFNVYGYGVDIKASNLKHQAKNGKTKRWSFSVKKQEFCADFIVCFAYNEDKTYRILLIPGQLLRNYQSISIGQAFDGKWADFEIGKEELPFFFKQISDKAA